jgi:predicted deacetylase
MPDVNDTVAVALITSLSTLSAAGLAGSVSAWTTRRQLGHQAQLAREERLEQRAAEFREMRRAAYERFLSQADAAYRVLDDGWLARPFTESPRWEAGFAARRALDEAYIRVRLVGPEDVAERAAQVVRGIGEEFRSHARIVAAHPQVSESAAELGSLARARALRVRITVSADFVAAARHALEGDLRHITDAT